MKTWNGRPVLDYADDAQLEAAAGVNEFRGGLPREQAEEKAHRDYLADRGMDAAAHHYRGMRIAAAAGQDEEAEKHAVAYANAAKHAGFSHTDAPQAVLDRLRSTKPIYRYQAHEADELLAPPEPVEDAPESDLPKKPQPAASAQAV